MKTGPSCDRDEIIVCMVLAFCTGNALIHSLQTRRLNVVEMTGRTSNERSLAVKKNRLWTPEEDHRLLEMRADGRPTFSIAAALNRSATAVGAHLSILRHRARNQNPDEDMKDEQG